MRELSDAARVLEHREHFGEQLEFALALVGARFGDAAAPDVQEIAEVELGVDLMERGDVLLAGDGAPSALHSWADDGFDRERDSRGQGGVGRREGGGSRAPRTAGEIVAPYALSPVEEDHPQLVYRSVPRAARSLGDGSTSSARPVGRISTPLQDRVLRRVTPGRRIDDDRIVQRLAEAQPLERLLYRRRRRVRGPVEILTDLLIAVGPFARDAEEFAASVNLTFPAGEVRCRAFRRDPRDGCGEGPIWHWQPLRPPRTATTMLILSGDVGVDQDDRVRALDDLVQELARLGHHAHIIWFGSELPRAVRRRHRWIVVDP